MSTARPKPRRGEPVCACSAARQATALRARPTPREFVFPADHGSHPEFRTEWWYFTGNLATASGRHFGFELTFFRYALAAPAARLESSSAWRTDQIWMAHFAVTDSAGGRFIARERLTREALGLAGATAEPLRVWVKDWSAIGGANDELSVRLEARDEAIGARPAAEVDRAARRARRSRAGCQGRREPATPRTITRSRGSRPTAR